jgi:DNA-binding response OmpR family regulator
MKSILLVEDDMEVASFIRKGLTEEGYQVTVTFDGSSGLQTALANYFDVIILDLMLPGINGLEVCRGIRKENRKVSILFLTALGTAENVVIGLESEADDYLIKPFKFIELLARIKSLLRRSDIALRPFQVTDEIYQVSDLQINDYTKTVKRGVQTISLTSTEYRLLLLLIKNPMRVFSRMEILELVWGINFNLGTNVVDVYVNYLRKKLDKGKSNKLIHTVVGMGYVLKESDENTN